MRSTEYVFVLLVTAALGYGAFIGHTLLGAYIASHLPRSLFLSGYGLLLLPGFGSALVNRPISVRLYADRVVMAAEGQVIAEHIRPIDRAHDGGQTIYGWRYYPSVVQRKPGALRSGAPFTRLHEISSRCRGPLPKIPGRAQRSHATGSQRIRSTRQMWLQW